MNHQVMRDAFMRYAERQGTAAADGQQDTGANRVAPVRRAGRTVTQHRRRALPVTVTGPGGRVRVTGGPAVGRAAQRVSLQEAQRVAEDYAAALAELAALA